MTARDKSQLLVKNEVLFPFSAMPLFDKIEDAERKEPP
jgi:hypothetical protein